MLGKISQMVEGNISEFASLDKNISVKRDEQDVNCIHVDFVCFYMTQGDNPDTHFDFSYSTTRTMIRDASPQMQQRMEQFMNSMIEDAIDELEIEGLEDVQKEL